MKKYEAPQMLVVDYEPIDVIAVSGTSSEDPTTSRRDDEGSALVDWGEYMNKDYTGN